MLPVYYALVPKERFLYLTMTVLYKGQPEAKEIFEHRP